MGSKAETFFSSDISQTSSLAVEDWESVHGGFGTLILNTKDPNYAMPLSTIRYLEDIGTIAGIYPYFFSTTGNGTAVSAARRMGSEIVAELKETTWTAFYWSRPEAVATVAAQRSQKRSSGKEFQWR